MSHETPAAATPAATLTADEAHVFGELVALARAGLVAGVRMTPGEWRALSVPERVAASQAGEQLLEQIVEQLAARIVVLSCDPAQAGALLDGGKSLRRGALMRAVQEMTAETRGRQAVM